MDISQKFRFVFDEKTDCFDCLIETKDRLRKKTFATRISKSIDLFVHCIN